MYVWKPTKRNQYKNISDLRLEGGRLGINSERSDSYSENSEKDSDIELMIRKKKKMAEKDGDDSKDDENNEDSVKNKEEVQNKEEQNKDSLNIDEKDVEEDSDDTDDLIKLNGISVDEEEDEEPASLTKM
ncbi:hypothetical protein MHBO_005046 [Bonamia ostreae]|uniref:Uncharacterized protein n=1 Tax=Bonamia ostreae TaxID=126728 RepID=A0ABV2AV06_9EUKA